MLLWFLPIFFIALYYNTKLTLPTMFSVRVYLQIAAALAATVVSFLAWSYLTSPSKLSIAMLFHQYPTHSNRAALLFLVVL